jgi:hypothetical protein
MNAELGLDEYLDEIREQVCSRCIERPPGGPPCAPLGKCCGIELNLKRLVEAVQTVRSDSLGPYIPVYEEHVCAHCANRPTSQCPCALDYLFLLAVEAIETVDERRQMASNLARPASPAYEPVEKRGLAPMK